MSTQGGDGTIRIVAFRDDLLAVVLSLQGILFGGLELLRALLKLAFLLFSSVLVMLVSTLKIVGFFTLDQCLLAFLAELLFSAA